MNAPLWAMLPRLVALGIPSCFALAAALVSVREPFRRASKAAYAAFGLALLLAAMGARSTNETAPATTLTAFVRLDVLTYVMLLLVGFVAVVVVRYARTYLRGDAGQGRFARALLATLAAVTVLAIANDLLVIVLAWMATSVALHQLLTFYRERPPALVAAHKKFLVSRLADGCLLGALGLMRVTVGSLDLDSANAWASAHDSSTSLEIGAVLWVLGVSLKSAQLPFHGWLIQVMEAPTPVSALLHAGIVNIGGFVMIRLAPFMAHAPIARTLLVVIGTTTAVVAALVMTTRVSVKVGLAWSTCAQMGFMLVECGLGLWSLALLHLVAHSLYKAHAFLASGTAVDVWRAQAIAPRRSPVAVTRVLGASGLVFAAVAAGYLFAWRVIPGAAPPSLTSAPLTLLLGWSLSPLVVRALEGGAGPLVGALLRAAGASALYVGGHALAGHVLHLPQPAPLPFVSLFVTAGFGLLFGVQLLVQCRPHGWFVRELQPRLFAGLYLDEVFTRLTFLIWPPRMHDREVVRSRARVAEPAEAQ